MGNATHKIWIRTCVQSIRRYNIFASAKVSEEIFASLHGILGHTLFVDNVIVATSMMHQLLVESAFTCKLSK